MSAPLVGNRSSVSAARRFMATLGAAALTILLLLRNSPRELAARVVSMRAYATRDLAVRRLGGSSTAFDRNFFIFLESARRKLPKGTRGLVISMPEPTPSARYLAAYQLAPVLVALAPEPAPADWLVARYGARRPAGERVIAEVPGGALLEPAAPQR